MIIVPIKTKIMLYQNISLLIKSSLLILIIGGSSPVVSQSRLIYPELDRALLRIWILDDQSSDDQYKAAIVEFEAVWKKLRTEISKEKVEHFDMNLLAMDLDHLLRLMNASHKKRNYGQLKNYADHFMWEFRSVRQCSYIETYPLDLLWNAFEVYKEIHYTIEDPMFGLREWSEFEDLVNDFICEYENYDLIHNRQLLEYFAGIDLKNHDATKEKLSSCLYNLILSFESGYQADYVVPCDELGEAIQQIFEVYAASNISTPIISRGIM